MITAIGVRAKEAKQDHKMKILTITRSYSRTVQIKQYEPANYFASFTAELDEKDKVEEVSVKLDELARQEVMKSAEKELPRCDSCGGIPRFKTNNFVCEDCKKDQAIKIKTI